MCSKAGGEFHRHHVGPPFRKMAEVEISAQAYVKMQLHAAKYPSCAVNGLLLAEKVPEADGECLLLTDCVPLFHNCLALTVMLEVALNQLDNAKLSGEYGGPAVIVHERQDGKWTPKDKNLVMWRDWVGTRSLVSELMEGRAYGRLVDFDEHLDDIRRDWSNGHINERVGAHAPTANGRA
ncbi:ER membrane protein complex subunit 9-like isoform X4 [Heterodontus francisci]|uniref:ER membrane protein complex subunit 9-like isoform X4 n=1 Tax=Heterodontus francisci TaxID=7792 RepID=UPI00355AD377